MADAKTLSWYPAVLLSIRPEWKIDQLPTLLGTGNPNDWTLIPEGESRVAALNGDTLTAARKLDAWTRKIPRWASVGLPVLLTRMALARAYELDGDDAASLRTWEAADIGPEPLYPPFGLSNAGFWQRIRYERARLLRKMGRANEAAPIEAALKRDLRLADPDHPILLRLREPGRRAFELY